jgi:glycosyltransferase involved in cell wall biosynthesis
VRPNANAIHVSYCHSPFRYAWHEREPAVEHVPALVRPLGRGLLRHIRNWDEAASQRVTHYIANSHITAERIHDYYARDATVIHPPVQIERFHSAPAEDFFLVVSEVLWHKRLENALQAAKRARQRLVVVGGGPDLKRLIALYGSDATFLGRISDDELASLYARARALVVPNIEEFGIAAVEAQAAGRPVIAADGGGANETVVPGETGVLVPYNDVDALAEAMLHTDFDRFSSERIRANSARFSEDEFKRRFMDEIGRVTNAAVPA